MFGDDDYVELEVVLIRRETKKAFNVQLDDGRIWWLPKSQIVDAEEYQAGDRDVTLTVAEWLVMAKETEE